MTNKFNYSEEFIINILKEHSKLLKIIINEKRTSTKKIKTYDLVHKKNASKYLLCSKEKLNKAIKEDVLMINQHYITNGERTWRFSKIALEPLRGKL